MSQERERDTHTIRAGYKFTSRLVLLLLAKGAIGESSFMTLSLLSFSADSKELGENSSIVSAYLISHFIFEFFCFFPTTTWQNI